MTEWFRFARVPERIGGLIGVAHVAPTQDTLCARMLDGTVRCLGSNAHGALGQGSYRQMDAITATGVWAPSRSGVGEHAAGVRGDHVCALMGDGTVRCRRRDEATFNGPDCAPEAHGDAVRARCTGVDPAAICGASAVALPVVDLQGATALFDHCALVGDRSVRCWGRNEHGSLGTTDFDAVPVPTEVPGIAGAVQQIDDACVVLAANGGIQCWGEYAGHRPFESLEDVEQLALAPHTWGATGCARIGGGVRCWGFSLGGNSESRAPDDEPSVIPELADVVDLGVGDRFACALSHDGRVRCWGRNEHGQLGDGTTNSRSVPRVVEGLAGVTGLAVGGTFACARLNGGSVSCWGRTPAPESARERWIDRSTPERVAGLPAVARVVVGPLTLCAITESTELYCWGNVFAPPERVVPPVAPVASPHFPERVAEDPIHRAPPAPEVTRCDRRDQYCIGTPPGCFDSEDACLDARANAGVPGLACATARSFRITRSRSDGREAWSCQCEFGRCRTCHGTACVADGPSVHCTPRDPVSGLIVAEETLASECAAHVTNQTSAPPSTSRERYCVRGAASMARPCPPPPPNAPESYCAPHYYSVRQCFRARSECEAFRAESARHLPGETDARCTVVLP